MPENHNYVLMIENDSDDRYFTKAILEDLALPVKIKFENYNRQLLNTLSEKPSLILLASNSVPENGIDIMKSIKADPAWSYIPLIMLTEQLLPGHINAYYRAGANSVIMKPHSVEATKNKIQTFFNYWFNVAELA